MKKQKNKPTPFLNLLSELELPNSGICLSVPKKFERIVELFKPSEKESEKLYEHGFSQGYWASGLKIWDYGKEHEITDLRAMFICFMACVNNEI